MLDRSGIFSLFTSTDMWWDRQHSSIHSCAMFSCGGYVCWGGRHLSSSLHRTDVVWCVVCVAIYHCGERFGECSAADFPPSVATGAKFSLEGGLPTAEIHHHSPEEMHGSRDRNSSSIAAVTTGNIECATSKATAIPVGETIGGDRPERR